MATGGEDDPEDLSPSQIAFPSSKPTSDGYIDYYVGERKDEPETSEVESTVQVEMDPGEAAPKRKKKSKKGLFFLFLVLALAGAAAFAPKDLLDKLKGTEPKEPEIKLQITSEPAADVYRGENLLGQTPLTVTRASNDDVLVLRQKGFEDEVVTFDGAAPDKVLEVHKKLTPAAVVLDWSGAPKGARLWWNGEEKTAEELAESPPGPFVLKVEPADGASVTLNLELSPESSPLAMGPLIFAELAKRPRLNLSLALPDVFATEELALTISRGEWRREQNLTAAGGRVMLPQAGTYEVAYAGSDKLKPFLKKVIVNESGILDLAIEAEGVNGEKPTPKASPTPTPSPDVSATPEATPSPALSPAPVASPTPSISATPAVTAPTPGPAATPAVAKTPSSTPTPGPTARPTPPAATPAPSKSPAPVATNPPQPKATPKPKPQPTAKPTKAPVVSTRPAPPPPRPVYRPPPRRYTPPPKPRPPATGGGARIKPPEF